MRDLIFRAKKSSNEEWVKTSIYQAVTLLAFKKVIPETLGQWTGQLDKNGNEIFEGDIVEVSNENFDAETEGYGVICWDEDSSRYGIVLDHIYIDFDNIFGYECEVVGNIFDTPEYVEPWFQEWED